MIWVLHGSESTHQCASSRTTSTKQSHASNDYSRMILAPTWNLTRTRQQPKMGFASQAPKQATPWPPLPCLNKGRNPSKHANCSQQKFIYLLLTLLPIDNSPESSSASQSSDSFLRPPELGYVCILPLEIHASPLCLSLFWNRPPQELGATPFHPFNRFTRAQSQLL